MGREEYELVIGKLVLAKQHMTQNHYKAIDDVIEQLIDEYVERNTRNEL